MEPTFEKLLVLLADGHVEFVLVGGVAVSLHGYVRLTEDVDILVEPSTENIHRLLDLSGRLIRFASKADLIRLKKRSLREKDRLDVAALEQLSRDPHAFD